MNYKQIIFDVDGTLIDTEYASLHSLQDTVRQLLGRTVPLPDLQFAMFLPDAVSLRRLGIDDVRRGTQMRLEHFLRYLSTVSLFSGMRDTLTELKKRQFSLGIITAETHPEWRAHAHRFQLEDFFDTIICAEDTSRHKPDPEPMRLYLQQTGASEKDVLFIGDSMADIQCAAAAGVDSGFARWSHPSMQLKEATYSFSRPADILRLLSSKSA